jgi:hypothetical protein
LVHPRTYGRLLFDGMISAKFLKHVVIHIVDFSPQEGAIYLEVAK